MIIFITQGMVFCPCALENTYLLLVGVLQECQQAHSYNDVSVCLFFKVYLGFQSITMSNRICYSNNIFSVLTLYHYTTIIS